MSDITTAWQDVERALQSTCPALLERLSPPATPAGLDAAQAAMGRLLPGPLRELYSIANGSAFDDGLWGGWRWLELDQMVDHHRDLADSRRTDGDDVRTGEFIPFGFHESDLLCVDAGSDAAAVHFWPHESGDFELVSEGLAAFLREFVHRVSSGILVPGEFRSPRGLHYDLRPVDRQTWPPEPRAPGPEPAPPATPGIAERIFRKGFTDRRRW
jgi:hypothetical protein